MTTLFKLTIPPDKANYQNTAATDSVSVALDGGASATRRDILNGSSQLTVSWTVGVNDFNYLQSFYRGASVYASQPFLLDIPIDYFDLTEYTVKIVPGTWVAPSQIQGETYTVTATLEVLAGDTNDNFDASLIAVYNAFGPDSAAALALLSQIVNVEWPSE